MKKILLGAFIAVILLLSFRYCELKSGEKEYTIQSSKTIQEQIKNVGKLVVSEGHFSEVYNFKDQQKYFMDYLSFEKKALAVVNSDVSIAYDLSQLKYEIDEEQKILRITHIPEEEISINPTITFYDVDQSIFNPFTGSDYNKMQEKVKEQLRQKIMASKFKQNAKNRLITELSKIYILTNSLGWTLQYHDQKIEKEASLLQIKG